MASAIQVTGAVADLSGEPEEELRCDCGHTFARGSLDILRRVYIHEWDGAPEDFNLDDFIVLRHECPVCSCCSEEDGEINATEALGEKQWLCTGCGTMHEDEQEALDCCE